MFLEQKVLPWFTVMEQMANGTMFGTMTTKPGRELMAVAVIAWKVVLLLLKNAGNGPGNRRHTEADHLRAKAACHGPELQGSFPTG
jgi:hypothetical protein